jgi:hypothetical protein
MVYLPTESGASLELQQVRDLACGRRSCGPPLGLHQNDA